MLRLAILLILVASACAQAGGAAHADTEKPAANVFVSTSGTDSGSGCARSEPATSSWPSASSACASMAKALSLAQPGDVVQLLAGTYSNLTISRQSGADSPKVIVRGDPSMLDQFGCAADRCAEGNVVVDNLVVCGHGLQVEDLDSNAHDQTYVYVGDRSCPGSPIISNHDLELDNVHFTQGTLRGTNVGMYHGRLGPEYDICGSPASRSDLLHIWPDGSGNEPVDVTVDHSVIWLNNMSSRGCGGAHADNIQLLGVDGLTFTDNIVAGAADDLWTDGSLNGTQEHGTILIADNFFDSSDTIGGGSVGVQLGLNQDGSATCDANYQIRNNTFAGGKNVTLKCTNGSAVWRDNFLHLSADRPQTTCHSGTFDYNVWDSSSSITCGTHAKQCNPVWLYPTANSMDAAHGWDLHLSPADRCLIGNGSTPAAGAHASFDIEGDQRPLRVAQDVGADQQEPASIVPGSSIGPIALGMSRAAVEARLGAVQPSNTRLFGMAAPSPVATYRLRTGPLSVVYGADGHVAGIATRSNFFSTRSGIGVGEAARFVRGHGAGRWIACQHTYVGREQNAITLYAANYPLRAAVSRVEILKSSLAAPTTCKR